MPDLDLTPMLVNGLRPRASMGKGTPFLSQCQNLMACDRHLQRIPAVAYPGTLTALSMSWPFEQFLQGDRTYLRLGATSLYTVNAINATDSAVTTYDATNPANTKAIASGGPWQGAFFGDAYVLTNDTCTIWKIPSTTSNRVVVTDTTLTIAAVANWNNRLVVGGLNGTQITDATFTALLNMWRHQAPKAAVVSDDDVFNRKWIIVGPALGGDNQNPLTTMFATLGFPSTSVYTAKHAAQAQSMVRTGEYTFLPMRHTGNVYAIKQYNDDIIVYGQEGVSRVSRGQDGILYETRVSDVGLYARGAVAGPAHEHVFVNQMNDLMMIGPRGETYGWAESKGELLWFLGYNEYFHNLTQNATMACYDPTEQVYWISDGIYCYILSRTGLSHSRREMPSSVIRIPAYEGIVGTFQTSALSNPTYVVVETNPFDGGVRDIWEIDTVHVTASDTAASATDRLYCTPKAKLDKANALTVFTATPFDPRGVCRISTSGIEHALLLTQQDYTNITMDALRVFQGRGNPSMRKWHDT